MGEDRKVAATTMTTSTTTTPSTEEQALPSNNNNKDRNDLDLNHHCRTRELRKQKSGRGIKPRSRSSSPPSAVPSAHSSSSGSSYGLLVPPLNIVSRETKKYTSSSKTRAEQSVVVVQDDYAAYPPTNTRPAPTRHISHTMQYDMETTKLSRFRQEASSPETPRPDCRESSRQTAAVVHPDHISPTTVMDQFLNEMAEVHLEDTKISGNNPRDQSG